MHAHAPRPYPRRLTAALVPVLLAACVTSGGTPERHVNPDGWLEPSPLLRQQIEDQIRRLPWTHGSERVEQIHWFAGIGEPAYRPLLGLCLDPRPDVAGSAVAALGATGDSRLVEPLRALVWPVELESGLELERARAFLRLGDWSQIGTLVSGLRDESLWTRAWCSQALFEATRERFGFDPRADEATREASVQRWEAWVRSRQGEGILVTRS